MKAPASRPNYLPKAPPPSSVTMGVRMSIYELLYTDTPDIVVINEAVELAKKYSDDDVKNMINGVLDKVYHEEKNE